MVSAATLNDAATLALANAMYRHTFGIVLDGRFGAEVGTPPPFRQPAFRIQTAQLPVFSQT
jgi:hypothetical protein